MEGTKYKLTQAYKSYADYAFPNDETRHPCCENVTDSVLFTPTNDECQFPYWKFFLHKCTACISISLPGVEIDSLKQAPMIIFNICITQFTCSRHGILIRVLILPLTYKAGLVSYYDYAALENH